MQIKKIFLYNVPYTENDHHQPLNSVLPEDWKPIKEFDNIHTHLFNFGTSIELTASYDEIRNANYAKFLIKIDQEEPDEEIWEPYYAWIDGFDLKSQQLKGSIKILYHWDYWRTFIDKIKPLRGVITSRISLSDDPPQYVSNITESVDETIHVIEHQSEEIVWIYMVTVDSSNNGIQRIVFPVFKNSYIKKLKINDLFNNYYYAPSFREVLNGSLLKTMGIEKSKIIGCSVSSIAPADYGLSRVDPDELKVTMSYDNVGFPATFVTDDLIEKYGPNDIRTYDDVHSMHVFSFSELGPPTPLKGVDELKKWCFPRENIVVEYEGLIPRLPLTVHLIPAPQLLQAFPFLVYMKYFTSYYPDIMRMDFHDSKVHRGSYKWRFNPPGLLKAPEFIQEFDIKYNHHITSIRRRELDKFDITLQNGEIIENVDIYDILVDRLKENERYYYTLWTKDSGTIVPKVYEPSDLPTTIVISNTDGIWPIKHYSFEEPLSSAPLDNLYLLDNAGYPITKFQQGRDLLSYTIQPISQNNHMFILFRFNTGGYIENTEFIVSMTPIDLTQEYYNEYLVSGERAEANERRFENIVSSLTNLAANAAIGTLIAGPGGGVVGGLKSIGKTILAGGLTTAGVGTVLGNYQQGQLENRLQNRGSFLIRNGNDYSWVSNGYLIRIAKTKYDSYSVEQYKNKVYEYGIDCNEIDNTGFYIGALLEDEGPIKLSSISLSGDTPYEANMYIRQKLLNGVFLDSNLSRPSNINNVK